MRVRACANVTVYVCVSVCVRARAIMDCKHTHTYRKGTHASENEQWKVAVNMHLDGRTAVHKYVVAFDGDGKSLRPGLVELFVHHQPGYWHRAGSTAELRVSWSTARDAQARRCKAGEFGHPNLKRQCTAIGTGHAKTTRNTACINDTSKRIEVSSWYSHVLSYGSRNSSACRTSNSDGNRSSVF